MDAISLEQLFNIYKNPASYTPEYGTAGFRSNANNLKGVVFRCGVLMGIKARISNAHCGVMITASHNPECDNGVKLIDYDGEMLPSEWEQHVTKLAQATNFKAFLTDVLSLQTNITNNKGTRPLNVLIGVDTRHSGKELARICADGVTAVGAVPIMLGEVTTPEMHFYTYQSNFPDTKLSYTNHLIHNFKEICKFQQPKTNTSTPLHVDCANGVGAIKLVAMQEQLKSLGLELKLYNIGKGRLNHNCGADYVEKEQKFPCTMEDIGEGERCCSLDGDADRIVYFTNKDGKLSLLNGDKIACLFASYFAHHTDNNLSMGLIQTAYANGASTAYIQKTKPSIDVVCTHTGVQHLHKEAKQYDIGIYFEANGHGTVLFNKHHNKHPLSNILSQFTGDALGNLLAVEYIIGAHTTFIDWINLYTDLYTRQEKVYAAKEAFATVDYGRVCTKPIGLQSQIEAIVAQHSQHSARAFVRPSGTEDLVRVYIEASQQDCLHIIWSQVQNAIKVSLL